GVLRVHAALVGEQGEMNARERLLELEIVAMRHDAAVPEQKGARPFHPLGPEVPSDDRRDVGGLDAQVGEPPWTVELMQNGIVHVARCVPQEIDVPGAEAVADVGRIRWGGEDALDVLPDRHLVQLDLPNDTRLHRGNPSPTSYAYSWLTDAAAGARRWCAQPRSVPDFRKLRVWSRCRIAVTILRMQ